MGWFGKLLGGTIGLAIGGPLGALGGGAVAPHAMATTHPRGPKTAAGRPTVRNVGSGVAAGGRPSGSRVAGSAGGAELRSAQNTTARPGGSASVTETRQAAFFLALFSILGKLAKADGRITAEEGEAIVRFLDRMNVYGTERQFAIRVFNEAKNSRYSVEDFARQFAEFTKGERDLRESLMDMLFQVAFADGELAPEEEAIIASVAGIVEVAPGTLESIRARYLPSADHAYAVLGLSQDASDQELRATYEQLAREYHPSRVGAGGMPDEFMAYARARYDDIQSAWNTLRKERGL